MLAVSRVSYGSLVDVYFRSSTYVGPDAASGPDLPGIDDEGVAPAAAEG